MLCASQASTRTISSTMDQTSQPSSSSSSIRLGGRTIDRHNPIIRDAKRFTPPPSPSPSPNPNSSYHTPLKSKLGQEKRSKTKKRESEVTKSSPVGCFSSDTHTPQGSSRYLLSSNPVLFDGFVDSDPISIPNDEPEITEIDDLVTIHEDRLIINASKHLSSSSFVVKKQQDQDQEQPNFFDGFLDYEPVLSPDNPFSEPTKGSSPTASLSSFEDKDVSLSPDFKFSSPQLPPPPPPPVSPLPTPEKKDLSSDQVVVLRVSLHCKGCAGKVKKHLSKMKGVTSFDIDFAAKKVTVTGDVTPLTVLATISKVKNAQFWPEIIQK